MVNIITNLYGDVVRFIYFLLLIKFLDIDLHAFFKILHFLYKIRCSCCLKKSVSFIAETIVHRIRKTLSLSLSSFFY